MTGHETGMKGIVLAGGRGSRLHPLTIGTSKQLLPVYDKPLIYYPLSLLMLGGIRDILVITNPEDEKAFRRALGSGAQWGVELSYATQDAPRGIAEALIIAEDHTEGHPSCLVLGDNVLFGYGVTDRMQQATRLTEGALVFAYYVRDPSAYGVVEFDESGKVLTLEEKPTNPRSHYAVPGIYFYDERAARFARELEPSGRGELEITDLNRRYLEEGTLRVELLGRGTAWIDAGTHDDLLQAANFVATVQARQGLQIACLEEVAWRMGFIPDESLADAAEAYANSPYGRYLRSLLEERFPGWYPQFKRLEEAQ